MHPARYYRALFERLRDLGLLPGEPLPKGRFAAFISYRHVLPDRRSADWLQNGLETYRLPAEVAGARSASSCVQGRVRL